MESGNTSSMQSEGSGGDEQPEYDSTSFFMHPNATIQPISHHLPSSTSHHLLPLRDHDHSHQQQQQQQQQAQPQPLTDDPYLVQPSDPFTWGAAPASLLRSDPDTNYLSFDPITNAAPVEGAAPPLKLKAPPGPMKKRTRASRRAPTTVLTTDTTNFRAMVQEFTGIPEPPIPCSSRRLDLFATAGSSMRQQLAAAPSGPGAALMNQDALAAGFGPAQPDPTSLAFQRLIQQQQLLQLQQLPSLFPPTPSRTRYNDEDLSPPAFGVMMNVDVGAFDPSAVRLGFGPSSSNSPQNHDYVRSRGALPPPPTSSCTDELAPPQGNINADHRNQ